MLDARDLARFALSAPAGTFDTTGRLGTTRADLLTACLAATGAAAEFSYVTDENWLIDQDVASWTELPLWGPATTMPGVFSAYPADAERHGLRARPLSDTVADTWSWQQAVAGGWRPSTSTPGLQPGRERQLLRAWHEHVR